MRSSDRARGPGAGTGTGSTGAEYSARELWRRGHRRRRDMTVIGIPEKLIQRALELGINVSMYRLVPEQKRTALLLKDIEREEQLRKHPELSRERRRGPR